MNVYRFSVFFDPDSKKFTFVEHNGSGFPISVPTGISLITFDLDKPSGAKWASTPIQWLKDGEPVDLPPWFLMHRIDPWHFSLWNFNSVPVRTPHNFELFVVYGGEFYSTHDPTIINDPPVGGG